MSGPPYPPPSCMKGHVLKRDRRYLDPEVWRCAPCKFEVQAPPGLYWDPDGPPIERACGCGCGEKFEVDANHRYQRFVDATHRQRAYRRNRRGGRKA